MDATIKVLNEHGLGGATIPRIAATAGVAPASVYRRFANKQALVQAAFLLSFERGGQSSEQLLASLPFPDKTVEEGAGALIKILFDQYRRLPRFLKAFRDFSEGEGNAEFKADSLILLERNLDNLVKTLLLCRGHSKTPVAAGRARFGLLTVVTAVEAITLDPNSLWETVQPMSDVQIQKELTRCLVSYLFS